MAADRAAALGQAGQAAARVAAQSQGLLRDQCEPSSTKHPE